jgi:hypothetical protein
MRFLPAAALALSLLAVLLESNAVHAKTPSRPRPAAAASARRPGAGTSRSSPGGRPPVSRRPQYEEEDFDEEEDMDVPGEVDEEDENDFLGEAEDDEDDMPRVPSKGRRPVAARRPPASRTGRSAAVRSTPKGRPPPTRPSYDDEEEEVLLSDEVLVLHVDKRWFAILGPSRTLSRGGLLPFETRCRIRLLLKG